MRMLCLIIGTGLAGMMILQLLRGNKYYHMVEHLDDDDFPLKDMYCAGLCWNEVKPLSFRGKLRETLVCQAKLLYDPRYAEYYATIVWAQVLSYVHLSLSVGFLLAGMTDSLFFLVFGLAAAIVFGWYFMNRMKDRLSDREKACTGELPEIVSTMALLINSGMMLRNAWRIIADSKEGPVYGLMRRACVDMDNGISEIEAIHRFGVLSNSTEIKKFASALAQSIEHGGAELGAFLSRQAVEMMVLKKQLMLQKGEAAASQLLIPTALIFVGIILVVLGGAFGMLI